MQQRPDDLEPAPQAAGQVAGPAAEDVGEIQNAGQRLDLAPVAAGISR